MGCQTKIAEAIVKAGGDYLLAVKDNQPTLLEEVKLFFDEAIAHGWEHMARAYHQEEIEAGHGRIETRRCWSTWDIGWFQDKKRWAGLGCFVCVESVREVIGGKTTTERRYYICSHDGRDAAFLSGAVRGHWSIENRLHWSLDVCFGEDGSRVRKGHGAQNLSRLRRMVMNLLRLDTSKKASLKTKRFLCSCDRDYLLRVLLGGSQG